MKNYKEALMAFEDMEIKERLQAIYEQVPSGQCAGCTACCSEAVNTFYSEYLNCLSLLEANGTLSVYRERAIAYYLTELVKPQSCPMLMTDGLCSVYEARPLPCRIFGHLEEADYLANQEQVLANNQEAAIALEEVYGFVLPSSVVERRLPFCKQFRRESALSIEDRDDLIDLLFTLESRFLMSGLLEEEELNFSLVQWFAYDTLGQEEAGRLRLLVTEEIIKTGQSEALLQTLDNIARKY